MFKASIDNKPEVETKYGRIKDLTQSMLRDNFILSRYYLFKVPKLYEMRPDLVSNEMYKTTENTELILKLNGISNPFSIEEGDILAFPDVESINNMRTNIVNVTTGDQEIRARHKYIDESRIPKINNTLIEFESRDFKDEILPPNISQENEESMSFRNGRVYFGENIGISSCLKSGISSGDFLNKVIKNKK